jgi:MioC protein
MQIGIFVATMTGLAGICAEEIQDALGKAGVDCDRHQMDGLDASAFDPHDLIVIVSSTYGQGDIPDNGQALYESLEAGTDLSGKRFAVFGMGDRTYSDTFCRAGELWDALLEKNGATRFLPLERHDASGGTLAEDRAAEWAAGWSRGLAA